MEIKKINLYKYGGKTYNSLAEIRTHIENGIGAIIDYSDVTLTPKQKLNLLKAIVSKKKELVQLLSVTFEVEGETFGTSYDKNILDL